jgi:hypothetical protein
VVSVTDPYGRILRFLDRSRYYFFQVVPQLYSLYLLGQGPVPVFLSSLSVPNFHQSGHCSTLNIQWARSSAISAHVQYIIQRYKLLIIICSRLFISYEEVSKSKKAKLPRNRPWRPICEMLRMPHCLDDRLTVNCEILATCSSTYSPVRTSQEAHSVSIK